MKTKRFAVLAVAGLAGIWIGCAPLTFAAEDAPKETTSGSTKFKAKPKWSEPTAPQMKVSGSASTGDQKVTLNPQIGMDMGAAYVGVGAKVEITTLPPDPKDKWIDPASLGGFKADVTPQTKAVLRAGNMEISATKTAPDSKKASKEVRFNGRENDAYWGNSMKGAVAAADADDREFMAQTDNKPAKNDGTVTDKPKKTSQELMAENTRLEAELRKVSSEMVNGKAPATPTAPVSAAPNPPAERTVSGYLVMPRPPGLPDDDWQAMANELRTQLSTFSLSNQVQIDGRQIKMRIDSVPESSWQKMENMSSSLGFTFQRDG